MKKSIIIWIAVVIVVLVVGWYLASPLFIDKEVDEGLPVSVGGEPNQQEAPQSMIILEGTFRGVDSAHNVEGQAFVLEEDGKRYLRFENFRSTNGPSLKVYLSKDTNAGDYISLGDLKGNIGNQNYEVPEGVDLGEYNQILIWCEPFSVLFGHAEVL